MTKPVISGTNQAVQADDLKGASEAPNRNAQKTTGANDGTG